MQLVPVDHDPFAATAEGGPKLVPVDHDPFAEPVATGSGSGSGANDYASLTTGGIVEGIPVIGPYIRAGADRAAALARSATGGKGYADELAEIQARGQRLKAEHPYIDTAAQVAGGVAGTLPLVATAPAFFGAGAGGLFGRSFASAASGVMLGGADAAVRSGGDFDEARKGALVGGGLGAAGPTAGALVGVGARKFYEAIRPRMATAPGAGNPALTKLTEDVRNSGGVDAVREQIQRLGRDAMLLDGSPALEGRAQGLAVLPDTRAAVMRPLTERAAGANARLTDDLRVHLGPAMDPAAFRTEWQAAYGEAVPPLYRQALERPVQVDTSRVLETIGRMGATEKGGADAALRRAWGLLHAEQDVPDLGRALVPDRRPEALHNAKEALDAMIATVQAQQGSAAASELRALSAVRSGVNDALEAQVPGYAKANRTAQHFFQQRDAFDGGQRLLNAGREAARPAQVAAETAAMTPEVAQAQRLGLRAEVDRLVGTHINDRVALQRAIQGEGDFNRARMSTVFGEEPTAGVVGAVERERAFDAAHQRINNNAMTELRRRAADDVAPRDLKPGSGDLGAVVAGAAGGVKGIAAAYGLKGAKLAANAMGRGGDIARNRELARAVTLQEGDALEELFAAIAARLRASEAAAGIGRAAQLGTQSLLLSQSERARPYAPSFGFARLR